MEWDTSSSNQNHTLGLHCRHVEKSDTSEAEDELLRSALNTVLHLKAETQRSAWLPIMSVQFQAVWTLKIAANVVPFSPLSPHLSPLSPPCFPKSQNNMSVCPLCQRRGFRDIEKLARQISPNSGQKSRKKKYRTGRRSESPKSAAEDSLKMYRGSKHRVTQLQSPYEYLVSCQVTYKPLSQCLW